MPPGDTDRQSADRGVSELIGILLLFGIVALGAVIVYVGGSAVGNELGERNELHAAESAVQRLDGTLTSAASNPDSSGERFEYAGSGIDRVRVVDGDRLVVTANDTAACRATVEIDAVRHRVEGVGTVVYQAGAVWRRSDAGLTALSWPDVTYEDGRLNVQAVGAVDRYAGDGDVAVRTLDAESDRRTSAVRAALTGDPECWRPETVNVTVFSDRYASLWERHFRTEMPDSATVDRSGSRVTVRLDRRELVTAVDDARNRMVNFTDGNATTGLVDDRADLLRVDKPRDASLDASLVFLGSQFGDNETTYTTKRVPEFTNRTVNRSVDLPVAMSLVVDRSGSMCGGKLGDAKSAARAGIDELNASRNDSVSVVSFSGSARVETGGTDDYSTADGAVDSITCGGGTNIGAGIRTARGSISTGGNNTSAGMVVLTDGRGCGGCIRQAKLAAADGFKVYTIGVGSNVNDGVLRTIASVTGGNYYHVGSAGSLGPVFREIVNSTRHTRINQTVDWTTRRVVDERTVSHPPVRVGLTVGGEWVVPWKGRRASVARQLNYPAEPERVHGTSIEPGESLVVHNVTARDCANERWTGEVLSPPANGSKVYKQMACVAAAGVRNRTTEVDLHVDGDPVPEDDPIWWQDATASIVADHAVDTDGDDAPDRFDLDSNQVVVTVPMTDVGGTDHNNAAFLLEVGAADSELRPTVINVQVARVEFEE